jgi:hypothetical protein
MNTCGVVQIKLYADGTFRIPMQFAGIMTEDKTRSYISGSENMEDSVDITGHFDATHLYFDSKIYLHNFRANQSKDMSVYHDAVIELFEGTFTVPEVPTVVQPHADVSVPWKSQLHDIQGRSVNPDTAVKGLYINENGKKVLK